MGEKTLRGLNSAYICNGASNHSERERELNDFYATPACVTQPLIDYLRANYPDFSKRLIWEPACGRGHISEVLKQNGYTVTSTDLIDRGYGDCGPEYDFLKTDKPTNAHIITNPPYKYAQQFVEKSMELIEDGALCCMLLKLTFLEGKNRYEMFKKYPPEKILVFSNRISCAPGGDFEKTPALGGAVAYAWYIWRKGNTNLPTVDWVIAK